MIIFGWGHRTTKHHGPTTFIKCPNCKNDAWWHLVSYNTWFTLFFIPIFPYESAHLLLCEVCQQGIELIGDKIKKAKELNELSCTFLDDQITESEYISSKQQINLLPPDYNEGGVLNTNIK